MDINELKEKKINTSSYFLLIAGILLFFNLFDYKIETYENIISDNDKRDKILN